MLKKRDLNETPALFELMSHPEVFPYVRQKATTLDEFYFLTKKTIENEEQGKLISRTIVNEFQQPIGTINLFDIENNHGFLATWIGQPYFGKGYNVSAKEEFFKIIFFQTTIETIFMKVRKSNIRSIKAALKIPYVTLGVFDFPQMYNKINDKEEIYDLFAIPKSLYLSHHPFSQTIVAEDEEVV